MIIQSDELTFILQQRSIATLFQPIVSIRERRIVGFEALSRGVSESGERISPLELFAAARKKGCVLDLDRLCRMRAFEIFAELELDSPLLFVNFDASILDTREMRAGWTRDSALLAGLSLDQIALEVVESRVRDEERLIQFTENYRAEGCLVVLDDFGADYSNLNRVVTVKPDVIKIDRGLIAGIAGDHFKESTVRSILHLGRMIGALVLAEGIETEEEFVMCEKLGVDLFQGYFFSRPVAPEQLFELIHHLEQERLPALCASRAQSRLAALEHQQAVVSSVDGVAQLLCTVEPEDMHGILEWALSRNEYIECAYLLDAYGVQVGETLCNVSEQKRHRIFRPAPAGTDHSGKDYAYMILKTGLAEWLSDVYLSRATGNLCRTVSRRVKTVRGDSVVLCVDIASQCCSR